MFNGFRYSFTHLSSAGWAVYSHWSKSCMSGCKQGWHKS